MAIPAIIIGLGILGSSLGIVGCSSKKEKPKSYPVDLEAQAEDSTSIIYKILYKNEPPLDIYKSFLNRQDYQSALRSINKALYDLGYEEAVGYSNEVKIHRDTLTRFHLLIGIREQKGILAGKETIKTLLEALKAKKSGLSWKKKVAGKYDPRPQINPSEIKPLIARLGKCQFADNRDGFVLLEEYREKKYPDYLRWEDLLIRSYLALGLLAPEEKEDFQALVCANYKFQILSGVNEDREKAQVFGERTCKALLKTMEFLAENPSANWREGSVN